MCTFGDWPVKYQLGLDAMRNGIALPNLPFVNMLELQYELSSQPVHTLEELLKANHLEPTEDKTKAKTDLASIVRGLNRMIRSYKNQKADLQSILTADNNVPAQALARTAATSSDGRGSRGSKGIRVRNGQVVR